MKKIALMVCLFSFLFAGSQDVCATPNEELSEVTISLQTFRNSIGNLLVSVIEDPHYFPDRPEGAAMIAKMKISGQKQEITLRGLKPGVYAITVLHDENENNRMDTGNFGIPKEGFGFSRNPAIRFRAPTFEETKIEIKPGSDKISIKLNYM